jgi:hypothetical protein
MMRAAAVNAAIAIPIGRDTSEAARTTAATAVSTYGERTLCTSSSAARMSRSRSSSWS